MFAVLKRGRWKRRRKKRDKKEEEGHVSVLGSRKCLAFLYLSRANSILPCLKRLLPSLQSNAKRYSKHLENLEVKAN